MHIPIRNHSEYIPITTYTINDIGQLALANLSPEDREILADRLRRGVHGDGPRAFDTDPEFVAEMERRIKAVEDGTAIPHPFEEVMAELRNRHK